jgi:hypothetical protein
MIRISEIDSLLGLVGFRQSTLLSYSSILDTDNIASSSGLYVNDISGLLTTKNIYNCQENSDITNSDFNTYLKNRMKSSFVTLLNSVFTQKDMLENRVLYNYENDFNTKLTNDVSFVGYEINVSKSKDINVILNKIMLTFDTEEEIKIILFHSSKNAIQQFKEITTSKDSEKQESLNWNLPAFNGVSGGKWYIGYLRSGLTAQAY